HDVAPDVGRVLQLAVAVVEEPHVPGPYDRGTRLLLAAPGEDQGLDVLHRVLRAAPAVRQDRDGHRPALAGPLCQCPPAGDLTIVWVRENGQDGVAQRRPRLPVPCVSAQRSMKRMIVRAGEPVAPFGQISFPPSTNAVEATSRCAHGTP